MQNKVTTRRCPSKSMWHWHHVPSTVLASWMTLWLKCWWKVWADDVSRHDISSISHATHTYWLVSHTHTLMHTYWCTHTHTHTEWLTLTWSDTDRHTDCCTDTHTHTHISIPRHWMTYKSLSVVVCLRMVLYDFSLRIQKPPHNCTVVAISQWASPVYYGYHIVRLLFWVCIYIYIGDAPICDPILVASLWQYEILHRFSHQYIYQLKSYISAHSFSFTLTEWLEDWVNITYYVDQRYNS